MTRVVVLGGSSGIGLEVARLAAADGWEVVVASRSPERAEVEAELISVDLTDGAAVRALFRRLGPTDHLVSSTAAPASGPVHTLDLAKARRAFETKLWGPLAAVQVADVRQSITLMSGVAASTPMRGGVVTAAINGAVEAVVRTLAVELAPVRVNAVAPGLIDTPLWSPVAEDDRRALYEGVARSLPVGRVGRPEEVAAGVLFLMRNAFTTGTVLHIDGGHRLSAPGDP